MVARVVNASPVDAHATPLRRGQDRTQQPPRTAPRMKRGGGSLLVSPLQQPAHAEGCKHEDAEGVVHQFPLALPAWSFAASLLLSAMPCAST